MITIGITGTLGAGKGTVVEYLLSKKGFKHYSARAFLVAEIKRRGMTVNRDAMTIVGNDLRAKHSSGYIIEELYKQAQQAGDNAVIESIRSPGEIAALRRQKNFFLLAVDADIKIRYERIRARASETDTISFAEFASQEEREMRSDDPNKQNLAACIRQADYLIDNRGDLDNLYRQIESIIQDISL